MNRSPELIVALDVPSLADVPVVLDRLPDDIHWYKVGLELFSAAGPAVLALLRERQKRIFLDLKLHDIPNTVAHAVRAICAHEVDLLTVHALGGQAMLRAAADAARQDGDRAPKLVAVTTLTSLAQEDLTAIGVQRALSDQAQALGALAIECGIDGLVCSVHEARRLRDALGPTPLLVTPGIRLAGDAVGDQKRVATPTEAVRNGSDYLVVGRSLLNAPDPAAVAARFKAALNPDGE